MTIENLQAHYGFTRMPFGRALARRCCTATPAHAEAVARIGWCLTERALGVITGEVGAGKTVAVRAALAGLDTSRTTIVYLPSRRGTRSLRRDRHRPRRHPTLHKASLIPQPANCSPRNTNAAATS